MPWTLLVLRRYVPLPFLHQRTNQRQDQTLIQQHSILNFEAISKLGAHLNQTKRLYVSPSHVCGHESQSEGNGAPLTTVTES